MSREGTFSFCKSRRAPKPIYLEVLHYNFAAIRNLPFSQIPLLLSKSGGHLIDASPVQGLRIVHYDVNIQILES